MKTITRFFFAFGMMMALGSYAQAEVSLNSARITSSDVPALAEFYKATFGMHEVQRIELGSGNVEIMLNFGRTQEEALKNPAPQVVIMHSDNPVQDDPVAHIIFNFSEVEETVDAIKDNGGEIEVGPFEYGETGIIILMAKDPHGNHFELLRFP